MKDSQERLVEELRNAGMAENQINLNMTQFAKLGWFYCTLNHQKALELTQALKDVKNYLIQLYGEVNGGWICVYISEKTAKRNFNRAHPETRVGEIFLTNISSEHDLLLDCSDNRSGWERIGWTTKRMGLVAYDIFGKPVNSMLPVFVQRSELEKAAIIPASLHLF